MATSDQSKLIGCVTLALSEGDNRLGAPGVGGGAAASGFTVKFAVLVTPPPETEIVTTVWALTAVVKILKPPEVVPAGIVTPFGTEATVGLLLVT